MNLVNTELKNVFKVKLEKFYDDRGNITNLFKNNNLFNFSEDKLTISKRNVLRGLHGDILNDKLIYCLRGSFRLAVVNYDSSSDEYLKKIEIDMHEDTDFAVFVPKNFLNGHYCTSDINYFYYKWSHGYVEPDKQYSVRWDSPAININWNLKGFPVLSSRDKESKYLIGEKK